MHESQSHVPDRETLVHEYRLVYCWQAGSDQKTI